jgi:hypothetical protein
MSENTEEKFLDRRGWPAGEWDGEPDRVEWRSGDLPCLIVRGPLGALCGYVGMPPGHPWHGKDYGEVDVSIHGGLTYAEACAGHICHVAKPGEPDEVWWLGFDCAHAGDVSPSMLRYFRTSRHFHLMPGETYKNVAYVRAEVERLAAQARDAVP